MKLRVLSIFGTRPEAVKMAPIIKKMAGDERFESRVCVTAQHRQMLDQVLSLFMIRPDYDLDLMQPDQSLTEITTAVFTSLDPILKQEKPDWILVQGDTTTVMASSLLGYYHRIKIGHVEAGLRTFDKWQPFPEEVNRKIASVVADLHFAPTQTSRRNLLAEGIPDWRIRVTGNPVIDALNSIASLPMPESTMKILNDIGLLDGKKRMILVTAHRRENFGKPLEDICKALLQIQNKYRESVHIIYPVHLNPNVQEPVHRILGNQPGISLLPPLDYLPLVHLLKNASLVLTDSGGIQEEATALNIPTLVLRQVTERPEGVEAGILKLVGSDINLIVEETSLLLEHKKKGNIDLPWQNPYGDGHAAEYIVDALAAFEETHSHLESGFGK